jgi:hypothetical protein
VPAALRTQENGSWYGKDGLWTLANSTNRGGVLTLSKDRGNYRWKHPWFTLHDGKPTARGGPPTVRIARLDKQGTATVSGPSNATLPSGVSFWAEADVFPAPGCYQVTASRGHTTVRFTIRLRSAPAE